MSSYRKNALVALREIYVEAENDVKESDAAVRPHRRGVLEGIRRAASKLFGITDADVVTKGTPYIGDEGLSSYQCGLDRARQITVDLCRCLAPECIHDEVVRSITEEIHKKGAA